MEFRSKILKEVGWESLQNEQESPAESVVPVAL
jgi:hypothetical protein